MTGCSQPEVARCPYMLRYMNRQIGAFIPQFGVAGRFPRRANLIVKAGRPP